MQIQFKKTIINSFQKDKKGKKPQNGSLSCANNSKQTA